jgi:hypothetical protein
MTCARAIAFSSLAAGLLLTACGYVAAVIPPASPSPIARLPTKSIPLSLTSTSNPSPPGTPSSTPTATPIPCDPLSADFCIQDASFIFQPPILPPGIDNVNRAYPFGSTENGTRDPHHGVEFSNASGTPVLAAADGSVYFVGDDSARKFSPWSGFYGNIIVLEHSLKTAPFDTLYTLYAHLSKMAVSNGQVVKAGEKIGEVGLTGTAFGSHLHFEVRIDPNDYNSTLNPELWLIPHPGNGTLLLFATDQAGRNIFPSFSVQYYPDRQQSPAAAFQVDGYASGTVNTRNPWHEVAALGDQPAGWYRVTFLWAWRLYDRWIEIQPGKMTRTLFVVK